MNNLTSEYTFLEKYLINFGTFIFLFFILTTSLFAQRITKEYLIINDTSKSFFLEPYLNYYNDEVGNLSINQINSSKIKNQFSDSLQITEKTKYIWVYFDTKINTSKDWIINIRNKNNNLYIKRNNEWITYNSSNYLYSTIRILVPKLNSDSSERVFMQLVLSNSIKNNGKTNIYISQKYAYEKYFLEDTIFYMLIVGIIFALFFYNLFLAISTRSYSYFLYSFSVFIIGLKFLLFSDLFKEFLIDSDYISLFSNSCTSIAIIFYSSFSLAYFKEDYKSKWTKIIISFVVFHIIVSVLYMYNAFYYFDFFYSYLGNLSILGVFLSLFIFSIFKLRKKALGAKEFLLANSFLIPVILVAVIVNVISKSTQPIGYILSFGVVVQLLLFSFAIASRFNLIKKEVAQKESERLQLEKNQVSEMQRLTLKKNVELEEQVNYRTLKLQETFAELQVQHNKVTDSIYYANNIQEAILPNLSKIKAVFADLFVFFRPRDVVSGDFYWYMPLEDEKYLLGAFDCTGHGVPGAFMSMISYQILNEVVLIQNKVMPNEILDALRKQIYFSLKQNENSNKDGLDACLVLIDKKEELLYFSGAKNHLYYTKKEQSEILQTIKGTNLYIGGKYNETDKFILHKIPFGNKDTQFYLSSDGIQDQFGGKENRKLMRNIFKEQLLQNKNLSSEKQLNFWNTFITEWQGENDQTDDMLLIGIRP